MVEPISKYSSKGSTTFSSKSSKDPLASLKMIGSMIQREIEETDKRIAHAESDPTKKASLSSVKSAKEAALRSLTNIAKMSTNIEKERELTHKMIESDESHLSELSASSIKSKSAYGSILSGSIKSLKSKKRDQEKLLDEVAKADAKMAEVAEIKRANKEALDKKTADLARKLNELDDEYKALRSKAKRDMASLDPLEADKLLSIPKTMKVYSEEISKLKETEDALRSKVDAAILNSAKYYLGKTSEAAEAMAVREIQENINNSQRVDLCFLMDATGSMASWINLTKDKIKEIINSVKMTYPSSTFFVSVVAYRDFDQKDNSFQVLPFTSDISQVVSFLSKVDARGGGDEAEDINGGFQRLLELKWSNPTKILFHFADAPCHGPKYANESDSYPNPASDISWEKIFREVKSLGIDYYFMKINNYTDKMTNAFADHWDTCGLYFRNGSQRKLLFQVQPINTDSSTFFKVLEKSILDSVKRSISSATSSRRASKFTAGMRGIKIDKVIKEEDEDEDERMRSSLSLEWTFNYKNSTDMKGVLIQVSQRPIEEILEKGFKILEGECSILIQNKPFAKGSFNHAYAAQLCQTGHKIVAKKPLEGITFDENLLKLDLKKKGIAITLANSFNKRLVPLKTYAWARISFVHTFLFKQGDELYLIEGFIDGKYVKYANNLDEIDNTKEIRHFTAFAHYSYEVTRGEYLVTDFQGVGGFLLTDPALHSRTKEFSESGDFGYEGFVTFFSKHKCNDLCKALGLKKPDLKTVKLEPWHEREFPHTMADLKRKCKARFCNAQLVKGEKDFCKFCSNLMTETITQKCVQCGNTFSFSKNFFFLLGGLFDPKKCDTCRKSRRKSLKNLMDDSESDDESGLLI